MAEKTSSPDLLIISGMIGGIEFYDISNPEILNHLDNLSSVSYTHLTLPTTPYV